MNDHDVLTDRLRDLGEHAPLPAADPLDDLRRGRAALRRRRTRTAAGVTTSLVAVGAAVAAVPVAGWWSGGGTSVAPSDVFAGASSPSPALSASPDPVAGCTLKAPAASAGVVPGESSGVTMLGDRTVRPWEDPHLAPTLAAYREAAESVLDPAGNHLQRKVDNAQIGSTCDPTTGEELTNLGTRLGWTSGDALGVVQVGVASPDNDGLPVALADVHWSAYDGRLPAGITKARVADFSYDGGGHAVVVERSDGLTVAVLAAGVWGNNAAPGSPAADDLPGVDDLVALAASPRLTLPGD